MGHLTKNANSVKDLRPLKAGEKVVFHGAGFHIVKDKKAMAKKKVSAKSKAALSKVTKRAQEIYKKGKSGLTWQQSLKKAGKEVKG